MTSNVKLLDPVQGLVDYVLDIKPYHTKIMEVLVEYVYGEPVDIIISDKHHFKIDLFQPDSTELSLGCEGGYSGRPFGDYARYPILSPNQSIDFSEYPAIDGGTNSFIVPGDRSTDLKSTSQVYLATFIETFIDAVDEGLSTFTIQGDHTALLTAGVVFEVVDSYQYDGYYTLAIDATFDGTDTTLTVDQILESPVINSTLGLIKTPGNNTGIYTVSTAVYSGGSIDSWPDITDPSSYFIGDDPHTVITVLETLNDLPILDSNQLYIASMTISPVVVEGALHYSNYLELYDPTGPTWTHNPDEGFVTSTIVGVTLSTLDGFGFPVPDSGKFTVEGNLDESNLFVGNTLKVSSSAGNNGTYVISSITYVGGSDETILGVEDLVDNSTIDGSLTVDIASNVFIVHGDFTRRFTQGVQFELVGGNKSGLYTTLSSDYVDSKTRVRVISDIFDKAAGYLITSISGGFVLTGDLTTLLTANSQFNVVGSKQNDGSYVVAAAGPVYNSGTHETTVPVDDVIDSQDGGHLHPYVTGVIKDAQYGYSESSMLCGTVPPTVVSVVIGERLQFGGLGPSTLTLSDDIIAYNLENTDTGSFDMPLNTIVSSTQPLVPEQLSAPAEVLNALWFDTNVNVFKQFNGYDWKGITTAWWFDTVNDLLYYKTKNGTFTDYGSGPVQVDTGWILDFFGSESGLGAPGFSDVSPAIGETEYLDDQTFVVDDLGGGVPQDTFTLDTAVPDLPALPATSNDVPLLNVTINSVYAEFTMNTSTEFTIISPQFEPDDIVHATIYDRTANETNARAHAMSIEPHKAYHEFVSTDVANNAYVVGGGNFIDRFTTSSYFDAVIEGLNAGQSVFPYRVENYPIVDVDGVNETMTIEGDHQWLFTSGRVFKVQTSENNYNEFTVISSTLDVSSRTVITVQTSVEEVPIFYNPGVTIYNVDNVSDTITVLGDVTDVYTAGLVVQVSNSTVGNNGEWTVQSASYDAGNDRTDIATVENIPDPDATTNGLLHTPIFQNYSRDLGVIWGAVYDPSSTTYYDSGDENTFIMNQVKTIVVPTTAVNSDTTGISYVWVGPIRMELGINRQDDYAYSILDGLGVSDELLGIPDSFTILNTSDAEDYFVIGYTDPVSGLPVNLTDGFPARTIFDVKGSYSNSEPSNLETNDAKYAVLQSFFDDANNIFTAVGGETKVVWDNLYAVGYGLYKNGILMVEDTDYAVTGPNEICMADLTDCPAVGTALVNGDVIIQLPVGIPLSWATGSGETFVQIDTEYDNIPPYNNFTVVGVSNNGVDLGTLTLSGDHVNLFNRFASGIFRLDVPLVSNDQVYNVITVTNVVLDTGNTVLTVQEEFIDEAYTGDLGLIETAYSGDVFYDINNVTLPWVHGTIFREAFRIDQTDDTLTATAIDDQLIFGWGTVVQWDIVVTDRVANFETIDIDGNPGTTDVRMYRGSVSIDGDQTTAIELNDRFAIRGSAGNDGDYEVAVKTYNMGNDDTDITPRNQPRTFEVTTVADVAGNLNNTYFFMSTPSEQYYIWMDVDNTGTDPAIVGKTGIEVHVPTNATADTIAINLEYALTKSGVFRASYVANLVLIDVVTSGEPQQYAYDVDTGFTVDNYTLPRQPDTDQQGIFELENVDITDWFQYMIQQMEPVLNDIILLGNATGDVQNGQQVRVVGTNNNDGIFTISAIPTYDAATATTVTPVTETIAYGTNEIIELLSTTQIKTLGNSAKFLDGADVINITNSTGNDGTYIIVGVEYENPYSLLTITTPLPSVIVDGDVEYVDRGGWAEAVRHQGINIFYDDLVGITASENVDAVVNTTALNFVDSWDAGYWDIGSFDESLGTVIHLYSNTF